MAVCETQNGKDSMKKLTALILFCACLTACSNMNGGHAQTSAPASKAMPPAGEIDPELLAQLNKLVDGITNKSEVFGLMGKEADKIWMEDGQTIMAFKFDNAANTMNPLVAWKSLLTDNYGSTTDCRFTFDRRGILQSKLCLQRDVGMTKESNARTVFSSQAKTTVSEAKSQVEPSATKALTAKPKTLVCTGGTELYVVKSVKKLKDGTVTVTYKDRPGVTGNIPTNAGAAYQQALKYKVGDSFCSDSSED
jgi:hypothetical protein